MDKIATFIAPFGIILFLIFQIGILLLFLKMLRVGGPVVYWTLMKQNKILNYSTQAIIICFMGTIAASVFRQEIVSNFSIPTLIVLITAIKLVGTVGVIASIRALNKIIDQW